MCCHVSHRVLTEYKSPAFVCDVARTRTRPVIANQIRDALVTSFRIGSLFLVFLGDTLVEASVHSSELTFERPSLPS